MSKLFVLSMAIGLCAVSTANAGSSPAAFSALSKPLPPAKPASRAGAINLNNCASFGPNFRRIEGTDTCVKIGGAVGVETGTAFGR
jgi:ABC-type enterobactin transport system permease subunit